MITTLRLNALRLTMFGGAACVVSVLGCGPDIEKSPSQPQAAAPAAQPAEAPAPLTVASEPAKTDDGQAKDASAAAPAAAAPAEEMKPAETTDAMKGPAEPKAAAASLAAAPPAAAPPAAMGEREQAAAGAGAKGRGYGGGIVTEPVHQYFTIQQRLVFEDQIPHAMNLYKAQHNDKGPPTHARFMKEIIADNSIPLPELPPGEKYVYDPKTEVLMVEHPAK